MMGEDESAAKRRRIGGYLDSPEIKYYLNVDVEPVELPELDKHAHVNKTYPPLVLDGASGVGKTQQAFSLLKGGKNLVYILLSKRIYERSPANEFTQPIYDEMKDKTKMGAISGKISDVLQKMQEKAEDEGVNDAFSIKRIAETLNSKELPAILELVGLLYKNVLQCVKREEEEGGGFELLYKNSLEDECTIEEKKEKLKGEVLFVDEALPFCASEEDKHRLKFLRNFGRKLGMRVVLAGTAATAANMWTLPKMPKGNVNLPQSRIEMSNFTWAEVQFLYKPLPTIFTIGDSKWSIHSRPLVNKWLRSKQINGGVAIGTFIESAANIIASSKRFSDESRFIWLSGACLSTQEKVVSPFLLKPSVLVQGHFFEPALLSYKNRGGQFRIYEGTGYQELFRKMGHQRVTITRAKNGGELVWVLKEESLTTKIDNEDVAVLAMSREYNFVEYALSNCVQICLAREPLFAVAISLSNHFESNSGRGKIERKAIASRNFKNGLRQAMPETPAQRTKGAVDGELHEYIMFAALQLSCNPSFKKRERFVVKDCVESLFEYLEIQSDIEDYNSIAVAFREELLGATEEREDYPAIEWHPQDDISETKFTIDVKMPWLVPACEKAMLEKTMHEYQENNAENSVSKLFDGLDIAGLVPGTCNSRLDAHAYRWDSYKRNEGQPESQPGELALEWAFEFRARSGDYSSETAMEDLMKKCGNQEVVKRAQKERRDAKKEFEEAVEVYEASETEENQRVMLEKQKVFLAKERQKKEYSKCPPQMACHGMLIAVVNSAKRVCCYRTVKVGDEHYLRVVVLVGNGLPPLKSQRV